MLASFTVEKFSLDRLREISLRDIHERYQDFRALTHFDDFECVDATSRVNHRPRRPPSSRHLRLVQIGGRGIA